MKLNVKHITHLIVYRYTVLLLCMFMLFSAKRAEAQNNVGIGTDTIHPSAVLDISDTTKGLLIPRTDTGSVNAYVNSLFPNPGVPEGLIIYDTKIHDYFYYDGILAKWVRINRVIGPTGITGITGPMGPTGAYGRSTHWRDSAYADPVKRPGDTCGDYYHQTGTGFLWQFNCDSNDWVGPIARWRSLGYGREYLLRSSSQVFRSMPATPGPAAMSLIPGLDVTITVPPDSIARVTITSQGMVQKRFSNDTSYNYVKFDFFYTAPGQPGVYLDRGQTVAINPNLPITGDPNGLFDKVAWNITSSFTLEGKISPKGNPLPAMDVLNWRFQTHAGQRFAPGHPQPVGTLSDVVIVDGGNGAHGLWENYAVMNVYVIYERSKNAPYPE